MLLTLTHGGSSSLRETQCGRGKKRIRNEECGRGKKRIQNDETDAHRGTQMNALMNCALVFCDQIISL